MREGVPPRLARRPRPLRPLPLRLHDCGAGQAHGVGRVSLLILGSYSFANFVATKKKFAATKSFLSPTKYFRRDQFFLVATNLVRFSIASRRIILVADQVIPTHFGRQHIATNSKDQFSSEQYWSRRPNFLQKEMTNFRPTRQYVELLSFLFGRIPSHG